jgi:RNA polymerase primary sigma factor
MAVKCESTSTRNSARSSDSLRRYLDEIGRYPLLSAEEEVELAKRIESGDPAARQSLVTANLRLVVTIAKSYPTHKADLLDLIQEGTLGLMQAADRFDWRQGTRFSTYAAPWIRNGIVKALTTAMHPIRLPDGVRARFRAIREAESRLAAALGRQPSTAEIADELGLTRKQVQDAVAAGAPVASLDEPSGPDRSESYAERLADASTGDPLQVLIDNQPQLDLEQTLGRLPDRSRTILELRLGLRDGVTRTSDAVAAELGLARQRVRQIELMKLRRLALDLRAA